MSNQPTYPSFECLNCGHQWTNLLAGPDTCPRCGHVYIKWDYEKWVAENGRGS